MGTHAIAPHTPQPNQAQTRLAGDPRLARPASACGCVGHILQARHYGILKPSDELSDLRKMPLSPWWRAVPEIECDGRRTVRSYCDPFGAPAVIVLGAVPFSLKPVSLCFAIPSVVLERIDH